MVSNRDELPFAPEGQCPICGGHCFTKEERKEQAKLARKLVEEIKRKKAEKELPKCFQKVADGINWEVNFCRANPECHFCNDPYVCVIPHYLRHLLLIKHKENNS